MKIALISDTHIPASLDRLPDELLGQLVGVGVELDAVELPRPHVKRDLAQLVVPHEQDDFLLQVLAQVLLHVLRKHLQCELRAGLGHLETGVGLFHLGLEVHADGVLDLPLQLRVILERPFNALFDLVFDELPGDLQEEVLSADEIGYGRAENGFNGTLVFGDMAPPGAGEAGLSYN